MFSILYNGPGIRFFDYLFTMLSILNNKKNARVYETSEAAHNLSYAAEKCSHSVAKTPRLVVVVGLTGGNTFV